MVSTDFVFMLRLHIINNSMEFNSRNYAKFKRMFVGPVLTRKQRIAIAEPMPAEKVTKLSALLESALIELSDYDLYQIEKKAWHSSYVVERRKKRDQSMPVWANKEAIQNIYIEARKLTAITGVPHEVDHIIPSNHPLVCGLHVEYNLQILTESENQAKSNAFVI